MFEELFTMNKKNAHVLKNEYDFNEMDTFYIRAHFWPILIDNDIAPNELKNRLNQIKDQFILDYKLFDFELFNRKYGLDYCKFELFRIKESLSKGKSRVWDIKNDDYFHRMKIEGDTQNAETLIISKKDEIGLEILINQSISIIDEFAQNWKGYSDQSNEKYGSEDKQRLIANDDPPDINLRGLFESESDYQEILKLLSEKKYIDPQNSIWIDFSKGNKGFLAAMIKNLHSKGYYKNNTMPKNKQIVKICKNSFGWNVGIDTVKRVKPDSYDFKFIPRAANSSQ